MGERGWAAALVAEAVWEAGSDVAGSPGGHPELLPHQSADGCRRSAEWKHQKPSPARRGYKNLPYLLWKAQRMAVTKTEFVTLTKAAW